MAERKKEMNEVERLIGQILRIGVIVSAIVIVVGLAALFIEGGSGYPGDTVPLGFRAMFAGVMQFKPFAIIMLGLFLLILTPVLRVVVSIYAFAVERDTLYVAITTIVLIILVIAMVIGYAGK
ncbi:DUF1634 domain-containing protein [Schleiferilactobacillus harbinensis]|uniref:DUF1634 domain-containing protein n=1 Tax=Schleiferilactobacillus harbinensis TaxID=304207 RepID=UPI0007B869A4|nr:DUF1634 domain-containing protein [Schleiferilactobacillus harbinensis]